MRPLIGVLVLALSAAGACGGSPVAQAPSPSASVPAAIASSDSAAPSSSLAAPSASPKASGRPQAPRPSVVNGAPPEIAGVWQTTEGERIAISFIADRYAISRGPGSARGKITVRGNRIKLHGSDLCEGVGEYSWAVDAGVLTLTPVGEPDPCGNRLDAVEGRRFARR